MKPDRQIPAVLQVHIDALPDAQWVELIQMLSHWLPAAELDPSRKPHENRPDVRGLGQRHIREEPS